jgi:hypothetical protein
VTYQVYHQYRIRPSSQSHMIDEVIRPSPTNPRDTCYIDAFMQLLFHILPLSLLIVVWSNRDLIISALRLMFVAISQNWLIDSVSLSIACDPNVFDGKYRFKLGLHILGAFRHAFSGTLRHTI